MAVTEPRRGRSYQPCDFRTSGLLSNESTRQLRSLHETFARSFSHALDLFLGSPLEVKLLGVEQQTSREFGASLAAGSYVIPVMLQPLGERAIARFDNTLFFPLLDLLLGGTGEHLTEARELTEIDEELFRSVTELMCTQLERAWKALNVTVSTQSSIKNALAGQLFLLEERVVVQHFEIRLSEITALFDIALPGQLAGALIRGAQPEASQEGPDAQARLRKRLLNCTMPLAVTLPELRIPIGDLLAMQPGTLLNLNAPVKMPVHLEVAGYPVFNITPVRQGLNKAAQLNAPYLHEK